MGIIFCSIDKHYAQYYRSAIRRIYNMYINIVHRVSPQVSSRSSGALLLRKK